MNNDAFWFLICFVAHELEEIILLPLWIQRYHCELVEKLPKKMQPVLEISRTGFSVIALWEGLIIVAVSLLFPASAFWFGMVAAYTLHLFIHGGQYFWLKKHQLPAPKLWTVLIELPFCLFLLVKNLSIAPITQLIFVSAIWTIFAISNLIAAHLIWQQCAREK